MARRGKLAKSCIYTLPGTLNPMSTAPVVSAKPSFVKREPVVVGGAVLALIQAFIVNAPDLGINLPSSTQTIFGAIVAVAGAFGVKTATRPAALSVPAEPAKAAAVKKVKSTSVIETAAKAVAAVAKPNAIKDAATAAKNRIKGR